MKSPQNQPETVSRSTIRSEEEEIRNGIEIIRPEAEAEKALPASADVRSASSGTSRTQWSESSQEITGTKEEEKDRDEEEEQEPEKEEEEE